MRLDRICGDDGSPLPLPLAGEGWGGGASAKRAGRVDRLPPPAALRGIAEARLRRSSLKTAAEGGLCSPASGRGEANPLAGRFNQRPSRSSRSDGLAPARSKASIRGAYNPDYASRHCRAGCPSRRAAASRSRLCSRNTCCRDFPLPVSRNRCSGRNGLDQRLPAWPLRALRPGRELRQRREF
jgi:hypothetical protein